MIDIFRLLWCGLVGVVRSRAAKGRESPNLRRPPDRAEGASTPKPCRVCGLLQRCSHASGARHRCAVWQAGSGARRDRRYARFVLITSSVPSDMIFGRGNLRRVFAGYADYYNRMRPHPLYGMVRRYGDRCSRSAASSLFLSSATCITNTSGSDFRTGQEFS